MVDGATTVADATAVDPMGWPAPPATPGGTGFGDILGDAAQGLPRSPGAFWAFAAVVGAVSYLAGLLPFFLEFLAAVRSAPIAIAFIVLFFLALVGGFLLFVVAPLWGGFAWSAVQVVRDGALPSEGWGIGFQRVGRVAGLSLMVAAPLLVAGMVTLVSSAWVAVPLGWTGSRTSTFVLLLPILGVVFVVPALFLVVRWSLALYALMDLDLSVPDALAASWAATAGRFWTILGLALVLSLVHVMVSVVPPVLVLSLAWRERSFALLYERTRCLIPDTIRPVDHTSRGWIDDVVIRQD